MGLRISDFFSNHLINWLMEDTGTNRNTMTDFERLKHEIRLCDVILVEGANRVSDVIKMVTQSRWSHAALYVGRLHDIENNVLRKHIEENYHGDPNSQLLIESYLGQGTIVVPIEQYKGSHLRICRPTGITRKDAQQVIDYAISHLGIAYDVRQILDLLRYLFPWSIVPRRLRSSLFHYHAGTSTRQICSTLLAEAFASVRFPILPLVNHDRERGIEFIRRNPRLCTPSDFDYSPYFQIYKFPMFEVAGHAIYRNLPWRTDVLSNDTEGLYVPAEAELPKFVKKLRENKHTSPSLMPENLSQQVKEAFTESQNQAIRDQIKETIDSAAERLKILEQESGDHSDKQRFKTIHKQAPHERD